METYILLCDRPDRNKGVAAPDVRLVAGLIGTIAAAILSFSGPRVLSAAQTLSAYVDAGPQQSALPNGRASA